jgi:protein-tyrosine phosphatase
MSTIQNMSLKRYMNRDYAVKGCQAIRIFDTATNPNTYALEHYDGKDDWVSTFIFNDVDRGEAGAITKQDAEYIVEDLKFAKNNDIDVVVHCLAGISRSGAVAQFAVDYIGFTSIDTPRVPNSQVYQMLVEAYTGESIEEQVQKMFASYMPQE